MKKFIFLLALIVFAASLYADEAWNFKELTDNVIRWWRALTPETTFDLLDAGADVKMIDQDNKTAWDYIQENESLKGTEVYWRLNDLRFK
jgi:hypothetical protein